MTIPSVEWFQTTLIEWKKHGLLDDGKKFLPFFCNSIHPIEQLRDQNSQYYQNAAAAGWLELFDHYDKLAEKAPGGLSPEGVRKYYHMKRLGYTDAEFDLQMLNWIRKDENRARYILDNSKYIPLTQQGVNFQEALANPQPDTEPSGQSGIFGGSYKTPTGGSASIALDLSDLMADLAEIKENQQLIIDLLK